MARVVALLASSPDCDDRVLRECRLLSELGHATLLLAWERTGAGELEGEVAGVRVRRFLQPARAGSGLAQLGGFRAFWRWVVAEGAAFAPHLVHANDLDTLPAGVRLARICGARLLYDSHEDYPEAAAERWGAWARRPVEWLERRLLHRVDAVVTVTPPIAEDLRRRGAGKVEVVFNAKDPLQGALDPAVRARIAPRGGFCALYIGSLFPHRMVRQMVDGAVAAGEDVTLAVGGYGPLERYVREAQSTGRVVFLGKVRRDEVPAYNLAADALIVINDPRSRNNLLGMPNKFFEAIAAAKPLVASGEGYLGERVRSLGVGLTVDSTDPSSIADALSRLAGDAALREQLSAAARAAQATVNWTQERRKLAEIYRLLLGEGGADGACG